MTPSTVDLHSHSTASDGDHSASFVVELAAQRGVEVLALTDHDTLQGIAEAQATGAEHGVHVVAGIELSAKYSAGQCHLLAWLPSPVPEEFRVWTTSREIDRERRAEEMVRRLNEQGFEITWEDVRARAVGNLGRPHVADTLVAAGHCSDRSDAFDRLIGRGCSAYVESGKVAPEAAIERAVAAGALVSLAHPYTLELEGQPLSDFVARLAAAGLGALEAHRGDQDAARQAEYCALAERHGLLASAGSDFHALALEGGARGKRKLGRTGTPGLSPEARERLLSRLPGVPASLVR
ncbi:MAG: PHP domain-containing protein [Thermoleophilia bacterium]|nr:PHP domain-containing protein [Thermoleophilia bacterium]